MLADAIPTEIGQLAQLKNLDLHDNQLIGACTGNSLGYNGMRVYNNLKKTSLLRRYNPDGAGALHGYEEPLPELERIDRYALLCSNCATGTRAYPKLKKAFLLHRQHSHGARAVHGYDAARAVRKPTHR